MTTFRAILEMPMLGLSTVFVISNYFDRAAISLDGVILINAPITSLELALRHVNRDGSSASQIEDA